MKLLFGENIKRERVRRGLTQEEVANHLGVSFQSVSKWERGEGYPDIELLPAIAEYFSASVDELLGTSEAKRAEKYDEINNKWRYNNKNGFHSENVKLMKEALRSFPNDALILVQLSTSLEKLDGTDEEKRANLMESIAVQEQIIKYCDDCEVRGATLFNICFAYEKAGDRKKALEQAKKLPNLFKARENALSYFLDDEKERSENSKAALAALVWVIARHMRVLSEAEKNSAYLEKAKNIIDILSEEKDEHIQRIYDSLW